MERDTFLRAVEKNPGDETVRLVFADWLDEHGEPAKAHSLRRGVVKDFGVDFHSAGGALTLGVGDVSEADVGSGTHTRTHPDGWTITGEVCEDHYIWVNKFEASHADYGVVWGDFEGVVFATSEEGFRHFWQHHEPFAWDYHDI
jgi:uncharacterized protein (TIGR02996 family)